MSAIKKYILEQVAKRALAQDDAKRLLNELADGTRPAAGAATAEPIAIVGMAGRFPRAADAEAFWQVLRNGVNCIRDFPRARKQDFDHILRNPSYTEFLIDTTIPPEHLEQAHAPAGYLDEIDKFDAAFFGIPPAEATFMDPHQRAVLEVTWEAMEDAGYGGQSLNGSNTGVFIGKEGTNYSLYRYCTVSHPMQLTGSWESVMASRISYLFDFHGPCMLVDTACSAGLVSIHMAAQSILSGECEQALAGGINLSVTGEFGRGFQGSMAMDAVESRDGVIRTFDARANGTVWGEGVAVVMLKRLSRALADRDPIHAVILGSAINNDGASSGLTAPDAKTQEEVIVRAWQKAGIDPTSLNYIEAHGTGTVLGDPIEFKGLTGAFRRFTQQRQFCAIGSLKTNMGHLVAASGVASLFKVVKSIQHREMAPTINFGQPNPYINFLDSPLYVCDTLQPWVATDGPRRAALSSFGFSHTNCHMVIEEAPAVQPLPQLRGSYCLTLAAHDRAALTTQLERLRAHLMQQPQALADLCYTLNTGRGHYPHRLALVVSPELDLQRQLARAGAVLKGETQVAGIYYGSHTMVSDKKRQLEPGDLSDSAKKGLNEQAAALLAALPSGAVQPAVLAPLAQLYVAGADIDWRRYYSGEPRYRLSLPTYPLSRNRVWADPKLTRVTSAAPRLHPLVQQRVASGPQEILFESRFSVAEQWILADHKIKGTCVVPGTTYLEMARVAAAEARGWQSIELRDLFFLLPMVVAEEESRRVRVRLTEGEAALRFEIESEQADGSWQRHVEGFIAPCEPQLEQLDLAALKRAASESIEHFVAETDTGVFQFGPHWDSIRSAWRIGDDALARLALPAQLAAEIATYKLHPSVLDNAVNLISQSTGSTYLPFTYKSFRLYAPFTNEIYSHVVSKPRNGGGETLSYDIALTDSDGRLLARISDYVVKRVNSFAGLGAVDNGADGEYLLPQWVVAAEAEAAVAADCRRLLILTAGAEQQQAGLVAACAAAGIEATVVEVAAGRLLDPTDPDSFAHFVASEALSGVEGILVWIDGGAEFTASLTDPLRFAERRRATLDTLFYLTQALLAAKRVLPFGLALVTCEAFAVDGSEIALDPFGSASAALGTVIGMEYGALPCRLLDTPASLDPALLVHHLLRTAPGQFTALRQVQGTLQRWVRELAPTRLAAVEPPALQAEGFYLITGGVGGLGLATARHLASRARVKVVLTGRSELAPREQWAALAAGSEPRQAARYGALLELAESLAALDYLPCDMADAEAVTALLEQARASHGPLRGLFHLAGVAGEGFLLRKSFERFDAVLRPKLEGLRNLYSATLSDDPDLFVLFSSIVALTGGEGQGDYAAANAFMAGLAWRARSDGRHLVAVDWPSWREIGMAADFEVSEEENPFVALNPADAFARLDRLLAHAPVEILPSTIQPAALAKVRAQLPFTLAPELLRRLPKLAAGEATGEAVEVVIRGKNEEELSATERSLAQIYAAVLGLAEIDLFTNFYDMGGNSIIATHLLKLIDSHFPGLVDISDIFSYSSIDDMGAYIDEKLARAAGGTASAAAAEAQWDEMLERAVEDDAAIESLLDQIR